MHDALTGLPNRRAYADRLGQALLEAQRDGSPLSVVFIDLDGFKEINDTLGHDAADHVLIEVARRLRRNVHESDTVARQGGDEFLLLLPGMGGCADVRAVIERVLAAIRAPVAVDGRETTVSASVGLACFPDDGTEATALVASADVAMYQAKATGRDAWRRFDPSERQRRCRHSEFRKRLTGAIERDEFELHYQPRFCLRTGRVVAVEALLRWHSRDGLVPPLEFIPLAEQSGLIIPLGEWVLRRACSDVQGWRAAGGPKVRVCVNLSSRQFVGEGIVGVVRDALESSGLPASRLEVEITESLAMANPDTTLRILEELRRVGVAVALDDFGTGYSSLAYLRQHPMDRLKIDRAFLAGAVESAEDRAIVTHIVALAHTMRLEVVAEGVETAAQRALVEAEGCDLAQGYGLARPMPAAECAAFLARAAAPRAA